MKPDWYMRFVLTVIAVLLGLLGYGRQSRTAPVTAGVARGVGGTYDDVTVFNENGGLMMFNKRTGELWGYTYWNGGKAMLIGTVAAPGADFHLVDSPLRGLVEAFRGSAGPGAPSSSPSGSSPSALPASSRRRG